MTVLITGANRSLGLGIVKLFAKNSYSSDIILTSRSLENGQKCIDSLQKEFPDAKFRVCQLDLQDNKSIDDLVEFVRTNFEKIDILINNAGFCAGESNVLNNQKTLSTNFFQTVELTEKMLPFINKAIITVGSGLGLYALSDCDKNIQKQVLNQTLTSEELVDMAKVYSEKIIAANDYKNSKFMNLRFGKEYDVKEDIRSSYPHVEQIKFPATVVVYAMSKFFIHAMTEIWARKNDRIKFFCGCPGWVATNLAGQNSDEAIKYGALTPERGGSVFHWLATNPNDLKSGSFYFKGSELVTGWGLKSSKVEL